MNNMESKNLQYTITLRSVFLQNEPALVELVAPAANTGFIFKCSANGEPNRKEELAQKGKSTPKMCQANSGGE